MVLCVGKYRVGWSTPLASYYESHLVVSFNSAKIGKEIELPNLSWYI